MLFRSEQKFQGGPSPYFFFLKIFYLLKNFFLGPGGARAPVALYLGPSLAASQRGGVGLVVSLSVSLVSLSRRHGDTAAALPLCLSPSRTLAQSLVALA